MCYRKNYEGESSVLRKKLIALWLDNDHSFLRLLIAASLINLAIIFWIGIQPAGHTTFLTTPITIKPLISNGVVPTQLEPKALEPRTLHPKELTNKVKAIEEPPPIILKPDPKENVPLPGGGVLKRIVFSSNRDSRYYQLYMINSNGEQLERLTFSNSFDRDPHVSYDGKKIAFTSNRYGQYQIFYLNLETKIVTQLTDNEFDKTNPIWNTTNTKILYTINNGKSSYIAMMNPDGSGQELITKPGGNQYGYGFSPDSSKISYEAINHDRHEIFIFDLATKKATPIVNYDGLTDVGDPVFSPYANMLVFTSDSLHRGRRQLYFYDDNVKHYYRLTNDELDKDDPVFSPDGKMIAYIAKWQNAWNIYVMNVDGTDVRNITQSFFDHVVPSWR